MRVVISRPKPVFRRFRLLFARLLPEPPGHPVRRSLVCVATWHMLIINWKVIVARIYCTISNPSGHHEIRSPWGKIGPPPTRPPLPLPIEPEALSHPATHRASTRCLEAAPALKALWGKGLPHKRGERDDKRTHVLWVSPPPVKKLGLFVSSVFIYTAVGSEVAVKPATKHMKRSLGFLLLLWYDFITQKNGFITPRLPSEASELFLR